MNPMRALLAILVFAAATAVAQTHPACAPGAAAVPAKTKEEQKEQEKKKNPLSRLKDHVKDHMSEGCVSAALNTCWGDKPGKDQQPTPPTVPAGSRVERPPQEERTERRPPRSDDEAYSSSKKPETPLEQPEEGELEDEGDVTALHPYDPHKAEKNIEVGDFYYKRKNYKAAISRYREALAWKPNDPLAAFKLAKALEDDGQLAEAHRYYVAYLELEPGGESVRGACGSLAKIESGLNLDADSARAQTALESGEYYLEQKNYPSALPKLREAAQLRPNDARAVFRLAQALEATGELPEARRQYQRYLEMEPAGPFSRAARKGMQRLEAHATTRPGASAPSAENPR